MTEMSLLRNHAKEQDDIIASLKNPKGLGICVLCVLLSVYQQCLFLPNALDNIINAQLFQYKINSFFDMKLLVFIFQ